MTGPLPTLAEMVRADKEREAIAFPLAIDLNGCLCEEHDYCDEVCRCQGKAAK